MTIPSVNDSVALFVNECVQVNLSLREGREGDDWFISVSLIVSSRYGVCCRRVLSLTRQTLKHPILHF